MADQETSREDRQLDPSQRRLEQAREQGQVARSRDLSHVIALGAGCGLMLAAGPAAVETCIRVMRTGLTFDRLTSMESATLMQRLSAATTDGAMVVLPAGLALMIAAVAAALALGGWVFSMKPVAPKFERLNPMSAWERIASKHALLGTLKLAVLATVLVAVAWLYLSQRMMSFVGAMSVPLPAALGHVGGLIMSGLLMMLLVLAAVAAADVPLQLWRHRSGLKMTLEEVKQEHKEMEGDPHVKGRIRSLQREAAKKRMLSKVPTASVVVTNPTHYAVALLYDENSFGAPRVVAKGADHMAARIREIAAEHQVPLLEAPPLARALYAHTELDREIPAALYTAVAQVLAYVFQLRQSMVGRAPAPRPLAAVDVPAELDPANKPSAPDGAEADAAAAAARQTRDA